MGINHDFTRSVCLYHITENSTIGREANLYKYTIKFYQSFFLRLTVLDA